MCPFSCRKGAIPLLIALLALPAWAARPQPNGAHLEQVNPPTVEVESTNGELYNAVDGNQAPLQTTLYGRCSNGNELNSAAVWADHFPGPESEAYLDSLPHHAKEMPPTPVGVPDGIHPTGVAYPAAWTQKAVEACNDNMVKQVNQHGKTTDQVLSKNWTLHNVTLDKLHGRLRCQPDKNAPFGVANVFYDTEITARMTVQCKKHMIDDLQAKPKPPGPKTPTDDIAIGIAVLHSNLKAFAKSDATGVCKVRLVGTVRTNVTGADVSLSVRNNKGVTVAAYKLKSNANRLAAFVHELDFATGNGPKFTATPGQGGNGPAGTTFTANPGAEYSGYFQMVGSSPKFESNLAAINFDCNNATGPGSIANPGSTKPGPATPAKVIAPTLPQAGAIQAPGIKKLAK
jgi:hypothetical protein